eukprot:12393184-Ditylum_brightwellii.AAC.1
MAKKLDVQTKNCDSKMNSLTTSDQEQITTNHNNTQQIMQEQHKYLDTNLKLLLCSIQKISTTIATHGNELQAIQLYATGNTDGPNNKCQKHGNKEANVEKVMENVDALCSKHRDAHAPDP